MRYTRIVITTFAVSLFSGSAWSQSCLDNLTVNSPWQELVSCIKSDLTKEIATKLAATHADALRGMAGINGKDGQGRAGRRTRNRCPRFIWTDHGIVAAMR